LPASAHWEALRKSLKTWSHPSPRVQARSRSRCRSAPARPAALTAEDPRLGQPPRGARFIACCVFLHLDRAETIATIQNATITHEEGRTAGSTRIFTGERRQRLDPRQRRRRVQPTVRLSNAERVATGSSGALRTDVVSKTAAARTQ